MLKINSMELPALKELTEYLTNKKAICANCNNSCSPDDKFCAYCSRPNKNFDPNHKYYIPPDQNCHRAYDPEDIWKLVELGVRFCSECGYNIIHEGMLS